MKKIIVTALMVILLTLGLSVGCDGVVVTGSGNLKTETLNFSNFTEIEAHNGFQLELTKSSAFSVEITTDDNVQKYIDVDTSGETLRIELKGVRIYSSVTLRAKITMPNLYKIDLSGGSRASIAGFGSSSDFSVELSGGSRIDGDIAAADADFELSGGSQVILAGSANDLVVKGSGGSQFDLEAFSVNNADINLSGGSRATVNVDGTLNVDLSGGSQVIYIGEPARGDISLSGESTLNRK